MFTKYLSGLAVVMMLAATLAMAGCSGNPTGDDQGKAHASTQESKAAEPEAGLQVAELQPAPAATVAAEPATEQLAVKEEVAPAVPAAEGGAGPRIHCDEPVYDFGRVDNMEKVEHDFVVKNIGDAPLELGKVKTSCGCTVAKLTKSVLAPGEETAIHATLSLKGKEGAKTTVITVPSNDPENPNYQLKFTGVAVASIRIQPNSLNFGQVDSETLIEDKTLTVEAVDKDVTFTVTKVESTSPFFETDVEEVQAGKSYKITVRNVKPLEEGPIAGQIRISTNDPARPNLSVSVYGSVVGDVVVVPSRISVNYNADPERRTSQYIRVAAGRVKEFEVTEVISPMEGVEVEFSPRESKFSEYLIKLTKMPVNGALDGKELIIKTNIPDKPEIRVPFYNKQTTRSNNLIKRPSPVRPPAEVLTVK